jgi:HlyD family secretion protein
MRAQAPSGGTMSNKARRIIIPVIVLVIVAAAIIFVPKLLRNRRQLALARFAGGTGTGASLIYDVKTQDVSTGTTVSGSINAARTAAVSAQAAGKITAVYKKEGDTVRAGEIILRIDSSSQDNQVAQAASRYRSAVISRKTAEMTDVSQTKAQLQSAVAQALTGQLSAQINLRNFTDKDTSAQQIANLEGQVKQAQANLQSAQNSLKSLQDYDTSALQVTVSDFGVQQAQLNLNMAQIRLTVLQSKSVTDEQLAQLQAQVNQAKSSLKVAQLNLEQETVAARRVILQEQVYQAQASVDQAESNLANASSDNKASQSDIDLQSAQVAGAQLSLENAQASYKTTVAQAGQKNLQIQSAQLQVDQAQLSLEAAQNNLASTQKTTDARSNDLELLKSQLDQANSSVTVARTNLASLANTEAKNTLQLQSAKEQEYQALLTLNAQKLSSDNYVVKAPWNGIITALGVEQGDVVGNGTAVADMADQATWNVEAYIDEVDILKVKTSQDATVTIDPYASQTFSGKVVYVGHTLTKNSENVNAYAVKIQLANPPTTLVAGMSCDASITLSVAKNVLAVPVESILSENGKKYVTVISVGANNKRTTTTTEVETGIEGDDYVQITSGLKAGDRILRNASTATSTTTTTGRGSFGGLPGGL